MHNSSVKDKNTAAAKKVTYGNKHLREGPAADLLREAAPFPGEDNRVHTQDPRRKQTTRQKRYGKRIRVAAEANIPSGPTLDPDFGDEQAPDADAEAKLSDSDSSSGHIEKFISDYKSVGKLNDTPSFGPTVRPTATEWIWNLQGITFATLVPFVEQIIKARLVGARASDWAWEHLYKDAKCPLPCEGLGIMSEKYAETWRVPFLKCVMCPSGHSPHCLVPVIVHTPTSTAWMTVPDAARYMGCAWTTLASRLPAALVSTRVCVSEEPLFRLSGAPARGINTLLHDLKLSHQSWGLTDIDTGEKTVIGIAALVCMSTGLAEVIKTLTPRMLPGKGK